jgi:hypothetical protein
VILAAVRENLDHLHVIRAEVFQRPDPRIPPDHNAKE